MAITASSSTLGVAANNIVKVNLKSENSFASTRRDFDRFGRFLEFKVIELEREELPNDNKLKRISNINIVNTFGSAGGLLSSLASGALDVGGFVRDFFKGRDKKIGSPSAPSKVNSKPTLKGSRLRIPGMRAAPIIGSIFAGLDFATGLAQGESVSKSAAGTAGSLVGSMLGGIVGQSLIPIPGVGYVIGSAVGGFLGGWGADRAYDAGASMKSKAEKIQEERLKEGSKKDSKSFLNTERIMKQNTLVNNFEDSTNKFRTFVSDIIEGRIVLFETPMDEISPGAASDSSGDDDSELMTVEGGYLPTEPPAVVTSSYGWRGNRMHHGVDYATAIDTPVSVIKEGKVTYAGWNDGGYGNLVIIKHPNGLESVYGHLNKVNVKVGQQIEPGTVIGLNGSTGKSSGPHVHFELRRDNEKLKIPDDAGVEYFRFGGNVKVRPRAARVSPGSLDEPVTDLKPGQTVQTPYGRQSSMPTASIPATVRNIKGYLIVPGHIAGDGTDDEREAVEKIAKYVVSYLKSKYPGVPIELWNNRNYEQSKRGFQRQMDDLQKKEREGWQVIELHFDEPRGVGRGLIRPSNLNPVESRFARTMGAFPLGFRGGTGEKGLAGPRRGIGLIELGNMTSELREAFRRNDPNAVKYFSRDLIRSLEETVVEGELPTYRAPSPRPRPNISSYTSYNKPGSGSNLVVVASSSQPSQQRTTPTPNIPIGRTGGSNSTVVAIGNNNKIDIQGIRLEIA